MTISPIASAELSLLPPPLLCLFIATAIPSPPLSAAAPVEGWKYSEQTHWIASRTVV